jgi:hypothetical protein
MEIGNMLQNFLSNFLKNFEEGMVFKLPEIKEIKLSEIIDFLNNDLISSTCIGICNACVELSKVIENCKVIYKDLNDCDNIIFNNPYKKELYKKALEKSEKKGEEEVA